MPDTEEDKWWERKVPFEELDAASKVIENTPFGVRDGNGVDVSLVASQMRAPVIQRLRRAQAARKLYERMHGRGRRS